VNPDLGHREIPFNYTSADDRQAIAWILGEDVWQKLEALRSRRVTGRSARLLLRVIGEVLVHRRNAYLYEQIVADPARRRRLYRDLADDLAIIEKHSGGDDLVIGVLSACRGLIESFQREIAAVPRQRQRIASRLGAVVGRENVLFDAFARVSHCTDATDWRLHLPLAVVMPTEEAQVAPLLTAIASLDLHAVPRGAGTGLTGGAVPLEPDCIVVNTEKLDRIHGIEVREFVGPDGGRTTGSVLRLEAGVITEHAMDHAAERGLVFATDPTSAWASTIGGNIAENAGGKTAVLWGSCLDNLLGYSIAMPGGVRWTVRRTNHPLRKILPDDVLSWTIAGADGAVVRTLDLRGDAIKRRGLWKDITNKALQGLPGVQKEGTDGVITSAEFVLYPRYEAVATLCLEFFGPDMDEASRVIHRIVGAFPLGGEEVLQALEHFDDEYVRAIGYQVKAARAGTPKAVLLVDIVGRDDAQVARGVARIRALLAGHDNTHLFEARDRAEARLFWDDRKKLGAIAARTNAFKLNEDVVLPLDALADFARICAEVNLEEERHAQHVFLVRAAALLREAPSRAGSPWLADKVAPAVDVCERAQARLAAAGPEDLRSMAVPSAARAELEGLLQGYEALVAELGELHEDVRRRRIVIATHMHAGDGNVHVNIPVMSNDRIMMRRAERVVDRVMAEVARLGGVCSGEHGIGITKLRYLDEGFLRDLDAYRAGVDPDGRMNPRKLSDRAVIQHIYTPSFNLLKLEARILQFGKLEELALKIAQCVRCGKCKPNCCVFHPPRGLFYHPRNKNLAIGALIEALLYGAQRERSARFGILRELEDVADHCTICHKCLKPCPVSIDTGEVSVLERGILVARGYKHTAPATRATLRYLESRSPLFNRAFRAAVVRAGGFAQRTAARVLGPRAPLDILRSPVPPASPGTLRDGLPDCGPNQVLVFAPEGEPRASAFYFPGCGSERLQSDVSLAALHVLLEMGARVVLPPPFLCCGFPHRANAKGEPHGRIALRDTIVFAQIREMFAYLSFDAVVVTCGTCREALGQMEAGRIFGAPVVDLARFAQERGARPGGGGTCLYHAPCHDSLDGRAVEAFEVLAGARLVPVPHCCSEAGTLAMSRPDISHAMLHRKAEALGGAVRGNPAADVILTNCPSCLQGLGRHAMPRGGVRHLAVELALRMSGADWRAAALRRVRRAEVISF